MNRFHSSGTPSANVEVMWRWKRIIPITATVPIVPPLDRSRTSGSAELDRGPGVGPQTRRLRQAQVVREALVEPGLGLFERFQGVLLTITAITNGKWRLSFDDAAPTR